jgi:DNA replication and repair protein RecF
MFIHKLHLTNFKNHEKKSFDFDKEIIAFTGLNGVGKTNVLDAIYFLSIGKSYFSSTDKSAIRNGTDFFRLEMDIKNDDKHRVVITNQLGKRKQIAVDDALYEKNSTHVGRFPVVVVSPNDQVLITGGSEERRRFMDQSLSQLNREYLQALLKYNQALKQRNALLKNAEEKGLDKKLLSIYDDELCQQAEIIYAHRLAFFEDIQAYFKESFTALSEKDEGFKLRYVSQLGKRGLCDLLQENLKRDIILRRTTQGIHKDDVKFEMSGQLIKDFGSQGQQKTFLIALKLTQFNFLKAHLKKVPLFIVDDIFDKLDPRRSKNLIEFLNMQQGQVFISHTSSDTFEELDDLPIQIIAIGDE